MKIFKRIKDVQFELKKAQAENKSIGFVPTMGALHSGHLELVKRSVSECDLTVVTVYVNPTQFNKQDDLEKYPRDFDNDAKMLGAVGCNILFQPTDREIYPEGFNTISLDLRGIDKLMEGEFRPGHFDGVVTIIDRFYRIIKPNKAYFGEKDYQQFLVVKIVAENTPLEIEVVPCKIEREESGLAMSSRNRRLNENQLKIAEELSKVLMELKAKVGETSVLLAENWGAEQLKNVDAIELEYLKIVDQDTLNTFGNGGELNLRAFVAAEIGGVRLIDNMRL